MKQYSLNLDKQYQRPVVLFGNDLTALLDTGAYITVWTDEEDILISDMGGSVLECQNAPDFSWKDGQKESKKDTVYIKLYILHV